jgi:hypothetical protein
MRCALFCVIVCSLAFAGCARDSQKKATLVPAGEKATVGSLVYSVVDTEIVPQLGENPASARTPQNRFYLVKVSVSNAGTEEAPVPAMTLVDDAGQTYTELADGANVPKWLGVIRKVGAAETEEGNVIFDAPAKHYRLKLTDDLEKDDVSVDIPLNFVHEQMKNLQTSPEAAPAEIKIPRK